MRKLELKRRTRIPAEQRRTQSLIARLLALQNQCSDEEWASVVAACREARLLEVSQLSVNGESVTAKPSQHFH